MTSGRRYCSAVSAIGSVVAKLIHEPNSTLVLVLRLYRYTGGDLQLTEQDLRHAQHMAGGQLLPNRRLVPLKGRAIDVQLQQDFFGRRRQERREQRRERFQG